MTINPTAAYHKYSEPGRARFLPNMRFYSILEMPFIAGPPVWLDRKPGAGHQLDAQAWGALAPEAQEEPELRGAVFPVTLRLRGKPSIKSCSLPLDTK